MSAPLAGIRVIEFGNLIAAPYAAMLLADLGADVVKVEPQTGDLGRGFGPFIEDESAFFLSANRGKRSVVLELGNETDRASAAQLCANADVVVHNLRRGALERRGLGYDDLRKKNPGLIYTAISAFGSDGPYADRAGIDVIFQAESGMISLTGSEGDKPSKTATTIGDYVAGTNAALAICAALASRSATGAGGRIDISLRDGLIAVQAGWNALAFVSDSQPSRSGTASPYLSPNQVFETAEGALALAIVSDRHFVILCEELGRPDLVDTYPTNDLRMLHRHELADILGTILATAPAARWVERLDRVGLPVGRVLTLPEVWDDPQVRHNQMILEFEHPTTGSFRTIGSPLVIDGHPAASTRRPPRLGEHNAELLS